MKQLKVYELRLKVYLLEDIPQEQSYIAFGHFLDGYLAKDTTYLELHEKNCYKQYVFDQFYPPESDKIYKKDQIYTVRIRTVNADLAKYLSDHMSNYYTKQIKGLTLECRVIPKKFLSEIYSVTPAIMKIESNDRKSETEGAYWKNHITFERYEARIKSNLIKKYNEITGEKLEEEFELYRLIELTNRKPIAVPYKNIRLLGDKMKIQAADNPIAQELLYLAIGTGICELNARGCGFVNYKYL